MELNKARHGTFLRISAESLLLRGLCTTNGQGFEGMDNLRLPTSLEVDHQLHCWSLLRVLSTCGLHQGLPCGGTFWVSAQGLCCFLTGDLKHSWVAMWSCSGILFPNAVHLILSCKGSTHRISKAPLVISPMRKDLSPAKTGLACKPAVCVLCLDLFVVQLDIGLVTS